MKIEDVNGWKQTAWREAEAELGKIGVAIEPTPAESALPVEAQATALRAKAQEALVPYLIGHLMRSEAALALATSRGILHPMEVEGLMGSLRLFAQAAAQGRKAFCQKAPCAWRGEVAEAGPVGECPTCKAAPVKVLELMVPPSAGNGKLRLVDG